MTDQPRWLRPVEYGLAGGVAGLGFAAIVSLETGHSRLAACYAVAALVLLVASGAVARIWHRPPLEPDPEAGE